MKKLSIIIPAYNEEATLSEIVQRVLRVNFPVTTEVLLVNDASTDNTGKIAKALAKKYPQIGYFEHETNRGKGAAVKTGIEKASGDYIVIQDADLEYAPNDILRLLAGLKTGKADIVYGSRLMQPPVLLGRNRTPLLLHYFGNKFLSLVTSVLYGSWITDMETCYKLFPRGVAKEMKLQARGFELEPEITAKFLKSGYKILEVPITTKPRGYDEGKKLNTWKDGYKALSALIKYRFLD